jgi:multidrug resistance efflux pump
MFKKFIVPIFLLIAIATVIWYFLPSNSQTSQNENILVKVELGDVQISVQATGELQAKYSEKIRGPEGMRTNKIYETSLTDIVPEGTIVKEGSYVASLDKTELDTRMKDIQTEVEKTETQLEQAKIDTAIEMRSLRDQLINLTFSLKEKELQLELNKYEPQATIRQVELEVEKINRDALQLENKIQLTTEKSIAKIQEIDATLRQDISRLNRLAQLAQKFTIMAPKDGMIIYHKSWNGKIGPGSRVSSWDPVIAELPDLSSFISKTFVNEVDISKISVGQQVTLRVDAFPDKSYPAIVKQVANIGEQLKNFDAKVFEVIVELTAGDSILRPAMTTQNEVLTDFYNDVLSIPIEAIQVDSVSYVFKKDGNKLVKQEVITGASNDTKIIIAHGLKNGDMVYANMPENDQNAAFLYIDSDQKKLVLEELEADQQKRTQERILLSRKVKKEDLSRDDGSSSSTMIIF